MQITFDTTTITDDEVRGIFALLDTVCPKAFTETVQSIEGFNPTSEELTELNKGLVSASFEPRTVTMVGNDDGPELILPSTGHPVLPAPPTVDSNGLPWHPDIHASSKALNADGTWRTKRGVDKALVASVEAELRSQGVETFVGVRTEDASFKVNTETGTVTVSAERIEVAPPPAPPAPPTPEAPTAPLPVSAPVESETEAPTPPATSTQAASTTTVSPFVALMKRVTTAQGAGKLTQPRVKELLESLDKKSIMDLRTDEDALASFAVLLDGEGV